MNYVGNHWIKCDLHLHTTASECYANKNDSYEDWISTVKERELDCVAVTDHNNFKSIDPLMKLGKENGITVFPGVEVTCDTSKIHILCIFSETDDSDTVRDFLSSIGITKKRAGNPEGTQEDVFKVCEAAKKNGAIVIAAHIDEYNGINTCSNASLKKLLSRRYLDAVQVVNPEIWEEYFQTQDKADVIEKINKKYNPEYESREADSDEIDNEYLEWSTIENWLKTYSMAKKSGLPFIAASDNPHSATSPKHGLWGIGKTYTWIKTASEPSLESIRQAMIVNDNRIVTSFECEHNPASEPNMWVKSMTLSRSHINLGNLAVSFNPQLNAIIGGRGTGKSSIIRLIGGSTNSINNEASTDLYKDQTNFFKLFNSSDEMGVFNKESVLQTDIVRNGTLYRIKTSKFTPKGGYSSAVYRVLEDGEEKLLDDEHALSMFKLQVFTQKEIYEIGRRPNSLLDIIDDGIKGIEKKKNELVTLNSEITHLYNSIQADNATISKESELTHDLLDLEQQMEQLQSHDYSKLFKLEEENAEILSCLDDFYNETKDTINQASNAIDDISCANDFDLPDELKSIVEDYKHSFEIKQSELKNILNELYLENENVRKNIDKSNWMRDAKDISNKCKKYRKDIDLYRINEIQSQIKAIKRELRGIDASKKSLQKNDKELKHAIAQYNTIVNSIRDMRSTFIEKILGDDQTIKISFVGNGNRDEFEEMLRDVFSQSGKNIGKNLNKDISQFSKIVFESKRDGLNRFKEMISNMRAGEKNEKFSRYAHSALKNMSQNDFNSLLAYIPSDEVKVRYKPSGSNQFKSLTAASAGQKTACILNIILSYGDRPLLLDQPEDDLDNKLVYDLIVKKLQKAKNNRQIIVVTHNANIPVNGDAECVISMETGMNVNVKEIGSVDDQGIREEICNVMEGSKEAFDLRAKKYESIGSDSLN